MALTSPAWPPSSAANGIVAYSAAMRDGFEAVGVKAHILVISGECYDDPAATPIFDQNLSARAARLLGRVSGRALRQATGAIEQAVLDRTRALHRSANLEILEMEETHGWAGPVARRAPIPVVVRLHGAGYGGVIEDRFRSLRETERDGILAAAAVSAPAKITLERAQRYHGVRFELAEVIPSPVPAAPPESIWANHSYQPGTILFTGRFDRHKGGDLMIDAFAMVASEDPDAKLVFAGPDRGLVDDAGRGWRLSEYVARLPGELRDRVELLGFQPQERLRELRQRAALLAVPSRAENLPYTVLEGLSQGCPTVAASAGGICEAVEHERNGLLFPPEDVEALARQILRLLRDPELSVRLGAQARHDVEARYSPPLIARRTLELYQRVI